MLLFFLISYSSLFLNRIFPSFPLLTFPHHLYFAIIILRRCFTCDVYPLSADKWSLLTFCFTIIIIMPISVIGGILPLSNAKCSRSPSVVGWSGDDVIHGWSSFDFMKSPFGQGEKEEKEEDFRSRIERGDSLVNLSKGYGASRSRLSCCYSSMMILYFFVIFRRRMRLRERGYPPPGGFAGGPSFGEGPLLLSFRHPTLTQEPHYILELRSSRSISQG